MRRSDFKEWGKKLTEESFWQAVAAVGVSPDSRRLRQDVDSGRPLQWRLSIGDIQGQYEVPAKPQSWRYLIIGQERRDWPRLEIVPPFEEVDLSELLHGLTRHAARSVYVALASSGQPLPEPLWRRPLRVGLWPAPSPQLARELEERSSAQATSIAEADTRSFDLLVLPASLAGAREALSSFPVAVRATALLLSGGAPPGSAFNLRQIEELRELTQARAVACAAVRAGEGARWLEAFTKNLSEGLPLDLALQTPELLAEGEPAILFAEPALVSGRMGPVKGLMRSTDEEWMSEPPEPPKEREEHKESFEAKPEGAYGLPDDDMPPLTRSPWPTRAPREEGGKGRFLQARILERGVPIWSLQPGRTYGVAVRIGAPKRGALVADRRFPDQELPDRENLLTVVFSEPHLLEAPQVKTLLLPPSGPSTVCTFQLPFPQEARSVSARLTVLYENRVLQTALLRGEVGERLSLTVEMVVRPGMRNLSRQRPFDGALILNHTEDGVARATVTGGYRPATFSVVGLDEAIAAMEAQINGTPWDDPDFASFDAPGSVELLLFLASHGERLYKELLRYAPDHPFLTGDGPVQLVSTEHGARLPLEFLYSRTAPDDDAVLCPRWREALATGACDCPDDGSVVCPLGFWCFRRVIERHRFSPDHAKETEGRAYALKDVPPGQDAAALHPLAGIVLGASQRVGAVAGTLEKLAGAVRRAFARAVEPARDWDDWAGQVQAGSPSLLVLLPHTEKNDRLLPTLEIGGTALASSKVGKKHVLGPAGLPKPVVLLLGCNTDNAGLPFESFVPSFADQQAAVVVTSLSKVLGRHAAPLAALFLEQLAAFPNDGSHRFGEVMREVRRRAALDGPPLALVLKAYGDADWRI